jgi:DNA modification methylase
MSFETVTIGPCTLIYGDARDVMPTLDSVEAVVSDPPYGIQHESHGQRFARAKPIAGDGDVSLIEWLDEWCLSRCAFVSFFSPFMPPRVQWRSILVWDKGAHVGIGGDRATCWKRDAELIGVKGNKPLAGQRDSSVLRFNAVLPPPSGHFCEKPLPLMRYIVGKLQEHVIVDPCMGSGTTGEACVKEGKTFIGIETEREWFDYSCERIRKAWKLERSKLPLEPVTRMVQKELIEA